MIDWHSHILPSMDDGSRSVKESVSMLDIMSKQGVSSVVATPHFYANEESVESFLTRRTAAYEMLLPSVSPNHPRIFCGAEVKYYPGIAKLENIRSLTVENTRVLLLEMPMTRWTEYTLKELIELAGTRGLTVVLAHIERYLPMQGADVFKRLCDNGLLLQVNASFFERFFSRRKAFSLLDSGFLHFLGSDTHNLTDRAPNLGSAYELIKKKFGNDFVLQMNEFGYRVLGH